MDPAYSSVQLQSGQSIESTCYEVLRIPNSDLGEEPKLNFTVNSIALFAGLLSTVHQVFAWASEGKSDFEVSLDLIWFSEEAENQPFRANIRIFVLVSALGPDQVRARFLQDEVRSTVENTLLEVGCDIANASCPSLVRALSPKNPRQYTVALTRQLRWQRTLDSNLPEVMEFDTIPTSGNDFNPLIRSLTNAPGVIVSMSLRPQVLSSGEQDAIGMVATILKNLRSGQPNRGGAGVSLATIETATNTYSHLEETKNGPLFDFLITVTGAPDEARVVAGGIYRHLAQGSTEKLGVQLFEIETDRYSSVEKLLWGAFELAAEVQDDFVSPLVWAGREELVAFRRLGSLITPAEAAQFFRIPIGSPQVGAGMKVAQSPRSSRNYSDGVVGNFDVELGLLNAGDRSIPVGMSCADLTRHAFVSGVPGSGKTNFVLGIVDRLWHERSIPFLIIEPAKHEYRALLRSIPDLQIFTPGKAHLSPLVLNPFLPPDNVSLESYKATLKTAFGASLTMTSPLDRIFEDAVNVAFSDAGWLNQDTSAAGKPIISIHEFLEAFEYVFENIGYVGEASNIGRAGHVRLSAFRKIFNSYKSIPIEDLLSRPTVIELSAIENENQKALLIAFILLSILSHLNSSPSSNETLRSILVLEEAHVLLGASDESGSGEAAPAQIAQRLFKRMLAETRSAGLGIIVADQSPRAVSNEVISLTNLKVSFRVVESDDRDVLAASMNMGDNLHRRLSTLKSGECLAFYDRLDAPEELLTANYRLAKGIPVSVSDDEVREKLTYWNHHQDLLVPYPECKLIDWEVDFAPLCLQYSERAERALLPPRNITRSDFDRACRDLRPYLKRTYPEITSTQMEMVRLEFLRTARFRSDIPFSKIALANTYTISVKE